MAILNLKPSHKAIKAYYDDISDLSTRFVHHEGAVSPAFATLLRHCASQLRWSLIEKQTLKSGTKYVIPDGTIVDGYNVLHGYWEAKDIADDIEEAIKKKFLIGYPSNNIIFQRPDYAVVYQDNIKQISSDISKPEHLIEVLEIFLAIDYQ